MDGSVRLSSILLSLLFIVPNSCSAAVIEGHFEPHSADLVPEGQSRVVIFRTNSTNASKFCSYPIGARTIDSTIASIAIYSQILIDSICQVNLTVDGKNLGYTSAILVAGQNGDFMETRSLEISVIRTPRIIDGIFALSVVILVSISYINMGCTLDWHIIVATMKRPFGPVVGLCCQYIFMPLVGYGLCHAFMDGPALRLSLFVVSCCPGGGASNFWTILLRGNLNLSVTMTFISSVAAFVTMPGWIFTLGKTIFDDSRVVIPYTTIVALVGGLVVPCGVGLGLQRCAPRAARFLSSKLLRPVAFVFIVYLLTVGSYANLYIVRLMTLKMLLSSVILTWSGFAFGATVSKVLRFPVDDIVAISVETGVQNAALAIALLRFSLPQPAADLALVVPAVVAAMVFPPLALVWLIMFISRRKKGQCVPGVDESASVAKVPELTVAVSPSPGRGLIPTETKTSLIVPDDQEKAE